ncbi:hypothetical protein [Mesorhizobium sp. CA16]|uniref:hypothetical protein n=1 Tax=Mesorhizobium sp. CA16 TaxID=588496 RepID=UPI001CCF6DCD|nr:hypothetical protein [Mesorhizobium sp. CA16]MBZ9914023.1 hypothetical protein [Mesorhizobium sp. CA16]
MDIFGLPLRCADRINANNVRRRAKVSSAIRDRAAVAVGLNLSGCLSSRAVDPAGIDRRIEAKLLADDAVALAGFADIPAGKSGLLVRRLISQILVI